MNTLKIILLVLICAIGVTAHAQDTNALRTEIGLVEARSGVVLIKAFGVVGSIPLGSVNLSVGYKQTKDLSTGQKVYGLIVAIEGENFGRATALLDDDELDAAINAVNYLAKITSGVTSLGGFEASYSSKSGLEFVADCVRKDGGIQNYIAIAEYPRIPLSSLQMTQLHDLLRQGRKNLDLLKAAK